MCFCLKCFEKSKYSRRYQGKSYLKFSSHKLLYNSLQTLVEDWLPKQKPANHLIVDTHIPDLNGITNPEFLQPIPDTQSSIHPIRKDYLALQLIHKGLVVLPKDIPDAPSTDDEDLGTLHFSVSYDVFTQILEVLI